MVLNSVTHHALHHEKFNVNFGLYFPSKSILATGKVGSLRWLVCHGAVKRSQSPPEHPVRHGFRLVLEADDLWGRNT